MLTYNSKYIFLFVFLDSRYFKLIFSQIYDSGTEPNIYNIAWIFLFFSSSKLFKESFFFLFRIS